MIEDSLATPHGSLEELQPVWINFDVGLTTYDSDQDGDGVVDDSISVQIHLKAKKSMTRDAGSTHQSEDAAVTVKHHPLSYWVDHTTGTIIVDKDFNQRVWWGDTDWNAEMVRKTYCIYSRMKMRRKYSRFSLFNHAICV